MGLLCLYAREDDPSVGRSRDDRPTPVMDRPGTETRAVFPRFIRGIHGETFLHPQCGQPLSRVK